MTDELRKPQPGMRNRRREAGSSVVDGPVALPTFADSAFSPASGPIRFDRGRSTEDDVERNPNGTRVRESSDAKVLRSTGSMAVANLASRITGFVRMILILAALGPAIASAFNTANTLPNMITELVLGSVITAMFLPLLARSAREDPDGGVEFIRRLVTVTVVFATVTTALAVAAAPWLTELNLGDGEVNTSLATAFAYLLLPQIFFYAVFSVLNAILNYNEVFVPGAWAPVWNNLIAIATLIGYVVVGQHLDPAEPVNMLSFEILLLGLGTTLGVVVQAAILLPALRRLGIDLRPLWGLDDRLKRFGGSALAGFSYVLISQVGLVMANRIGAAADESAIAIYQTNWLLLQVPYGILGVTLLTAINPRLADAGAANRTDAVVRDVSLGSRLSILGLVPVIMFMTYFGTVIANALFAYGRFSAGHADILGLTMAFSAFTLVPYALVLLQQRVFYARQDYWTPTVVIVVVTAVRIGLSLLVPLVAAEREHVVVGLALANGVGWLAGGAIGYYLLRRRLGPLRGREVLRTLTWTTIAAALGATVAHAADTLLRFELISEALGSPGFVIRTALLAVITLSVTALILWRSRLPEIDALQPYVAKLRRLVLRR